MPFIVRKITTKRRFDKALAREEWVGEEGIPADAVTDLKTTDNSLSVFLIDDEAVIDRVITALASLRNSFNNLDYVLLDEALFHELLDKFGMSIKSTPGGTPDELVNSWHRNLVELTDRKVTELARAMIFNGDKRRVSQKQILTLVENGLKDGTLNKKKVHQNLVTACGNFTGET